IRDFHVTGVQTCALPISLFRKEVELAKAEVKQEASTAGKAAGMYGGAGFAGYMVLLFLSLAAVLGLSNVMDGGWAALIVTAVWAVVAGVLFLMGRARMRTVSPTPAQTVETVKENAAWARHPTRCWPRSRPLATSWPRPWAGPPN